MSTICALPGRRGRAVIMGANTLTTAAALSATLLAVAPAAQATPTRP